MNPNLKAVLLFLGGVGLYGLWTALVMAGRADVGPLTIAIGGGVSAVLGYLGIVHLQGAQQGVTPEAQALLQAVLQQVVPTALPGAPVVPLQRGPQ